MNAKQGCKNRVFLIFGTAFPSTRSPLTFYTCTFKICLCVNSMLRLPTIELVLELVCTPLLLTAVSAAAAQEQVLLFSLHSAAVVPLSRAALVKNSTLCTFHDQALTELSNHTFMHQSSSWPMRCSVVKGYGLI